MPAKRGLGSSASKLADLGFDPIAKMYEQYQRMCVEIENQEKIERGELKRLNKDGSEKPYSPHFHMELVEKASNLAEKLLKYGYAPVKDGDDEDKPLPTFSVELTDGTTFKLNHG